MTCKCKILTSWPKRARKSGVGSNTGRSRHPLFKTWESMIRRCNSGSKNSQKKYTGRGIGICERWVSDFHNFVDDMGARPTGKTLDRKNNDLSYCPHNCRWASSLQQGRNRRGYISAGLPTGVHLCRDGRKKKYTVQFHIRGKHTRLGYFETVKEAAKVSSEFRLKQKSAIMQTRTRRAENG